MTQLAVTEALQRRISIRSFLPEPVSRETVTSTGPVVFFDKVSDTPSMTLLKALVADSTGSPLMVALALAPGWLRRLTPAPFSGS